MKKLEIQVYWTQDFSSLKYLSETDQLEMYSMDAEIVQLVEKLNILISKKDWIKAHRLNDLIDEKIEKMNTFSQCKIDIINENDRLLRLSLDKKRGA